MKYHILAATLLSATVSAIKNVAVTRTVDLMEAGSNLIVFNTDVQFENPTSESHYYYTIANDFSWSFVALQVLGQNPNGDTNTPFALKYEKVDSLPLSLAQMGNLTGNVLVFKIELPSKDTKTLSVNEFHKDRREPYPKVIRVYEKQTVELFESKYYLSVYPTDSCTTIFGVSQNDIHFKSHDPTKSSSVSLVYGPYNDIAPATFE